MRAELFGSNPHSKGDIFSRDSASFLLRVEFTKIRATGRIELRRATEIIISSLWFGPFEWKSKILWYTKEIRLFIIYLINKYLYIKIITPRLQNVNIMRRLQIRNGERGKTDV